MLTGEGVGAYLRSPRTKGRLPQSCHAAIERVLGMVPGEEFSTAAELAAALRANGVSEESAEPTSDAPRSTGDTSPSLRAAALESDTCLGRAAEKPRSSSDALPFLKLGHYEIVDRIGHGGMGDVYKGYERLLNRTVAIKVLPGEFSREEAFVRRFYAEATAAADLTPFR